MDDEAVKEEEQTLPAETPAAEEQETVQSETPAEAEAQAEAEAGESLDKKRPSRGERRIHELVEKLKEKSSQEQPVEEFPQQPFTASNLPWETSPQGEVELTPEQLEQLVVQKADALVQLRLQQERTREEAEKRAKGWVEDLERTVKENAELDPNSEQYNPHLDSALEELVRTTNFTVDGQLVPNVRASELYQRIKKALEVERVKGQSEASANLAKQAGEEGFRTTKAPSSEAYSEAELQKLKWKNPTKVAEALKSKLSYSEE